MEEPDEMQCHGNLIHNVDRRLRDLTNAWVDASGAFEL